MEGVRGREGKREKERERGRETQRGREGEREREKCNKVSSGLEVLSVCGLLRCHGDGNKLDVLSERSA